jgi:mono/diheme cytochrome c family protein
MSSLILQFIRQRNGYPVFMISLLLYASTNLYGAEEIAVVGKKEFLNYCASCHGSDAKGKGPVADWLKRKPANLTQLEKQNNGTFPYDRVYKVFDGSYAVEQHGTSEMPVWGYEFIVEEKAAEDRRAVVKKKVLDIILYIQSLQEK